MVNVAGSEFGQRGPMAGSAWCGSGAWRAAGSGIRVWHRDVIRPGGRHFSVANKFLWHRGDRWFGAARQGSHALLSDPSLGVTGEVRTSPAKDRRRTVSSAHYENRHFLPHSGFLRFQVLASPPDSGSLTLSVCVIVCL